MDFAQVIAKALRQGSPDIFAEVVKAIETHSEQPRKSIAEIRKRNPAQVKGRAWEEFCKVWITARYDWVQSVYLLNETPSEIRERLGLRRQDLGIDLIVETRSGEFIAVQAKYRTCVNRRSGAPLRTNTKVAWSHLSTFWGLVARSGPWKQHWVMTNCSGIAWKVPKTDKDRTLANGTFKGTSRGVWIQLSGSEGHRLSEETTSLTSSEIREKRLKALGL